MSRTYRRTQSGKLSTKGRQNADVKALNRLINQDRLAWRQAINRYDYLHWLNTPSWWHRMKHHVPARRLTKKMINRILRNQVDADAFCFPNGKKPHIYFW